MLAVRRKMEEIKFGDCGEDDLMDDEGSIGLNADRAQNPEEWTQIKFIVILSLAKKITTIVCPQ